MKEEKQEIINVLPGKEYLINSFIYQTYGSPHSWGWGPRLLVKGYSGFKIESEKEKFSKDYNTKIVYSNINADVLEKLTHLATSKNSNLSDVEKMVEEIKLSSLWKLENMGAVA